MSEWSRWRILENKLATVPVHKTRFSVACFVVCRNGFILMFVNFRYRSAVNCVAMYNYEESCLILCCISINIHHCSFDIRFSEFYPLSVLKETCIIVWCICSQLIHNNVCNMKWHALTSSFECLILTCKIAFALISPLYSTIFF